MTPPRTIMYAGNFTRPWCTEVHVAASLEALGHRVIRQQENEIVRWSALPDEAEMLGADMLLWTRTWPAELAEVVPALEHFAAKGIPTVSYHLDRWFGLDREHQVRDQPFFRTAMVVSPDDSPRWAEEGVNHFWMPPGVFGPECEPVAPDLRRFPHDVVFVGSHPYPHPEWQPYRSELIATFQRRFGRRFGVWPQRRQPLRGRDLQTLYATAKVVIGDSCLAGESHRYWSDRIPETLGRGGLLIHPEIPGHVGQDGAWYKDAEHLLTYQLGEFNDAAMQAELALDQRTVAEMIARDGRALVLGRDTYAHRLAALLDEVGRQFGWRDEEVHTAGPAWPSLAVGTGAAPAAEVEVGAGDRGPVEFAQPMRLEIGSGAFPTEGFTHLDIDPAAPDVDIVGPAFPLDLPDQSVVELRCVDVLEHISYRDTATALAEWARVLVPGGRLYVQVPDAFEIMRWFVKDPERLLDRLPPELPQTALAGATWRLLGGHADGVQGGGDWTRNAHYAMFSAESLTAALDAAGFDVESLIVNEHPNLCATAIRR